nr:Rnf-Nqr domain containing protein [Marinicella sp. W31]MDC2879427.1 Rnf-Nqr domain containing protein [Marinicella sp. W31]
MARSTNLWSTLTEPLVLQNPVTLQILGICSALAVTTSVATALTMSASLTTVLVLSAGLVSLIRRHIPDSIRLIVQIVIVASLVVVIDQILQAYLFDISRKLSVFVSLITTNCLVLGRTRIVLALQPAAALHGRRARQRARLFAGADRHRFGA